MDQRSGSLQDQEERELVRAVLSGNLGAFDEILARHSRPLSAVARRLLADPNELDDAVQETFIRAFQNLRHFRGEASLRTWLLRIAVSVCADRRRKPWLRRVMLTGNPSKLDRAAPHPGPEALTQASDFRSRLEATVGELPERLRVPFALHVLEELSGAEIAAVLGCSESTVWTRIYTARKQLRRKLEQDLR